MRKGDPHRVAFLCYFNHTNMGNFAIQNPANLIILDCNNGNGFATQSHELHLIMLAAAMHKYNCTYITSP